LAESIDSANIGQVYENTAEEKALARACMEASADRIERWRKKGRARRDYDLVTVLLSLGIEEHESPEHEARRKKIDEQNHPGKRGTQWRSSEKKS
jgi:hypothetical protein